MVRRTQFWVVALARVKDLCAFVLSVSKLFHSNVWSNTDVLLVSLRFHELEKNVRDRLLSYLYNIISQLS